MDQWIQTERNKLDDDFKSPFKIFNMFSEQRKCSKSIVIGHIQFYIYFIFDEAHWIFVEKDRSSLISHLLQRVRLIFFMGCLSFRRSLFKWMHYFSSYFISFNFFPGRNSLPMDDHEGNLFNHLGKYPDRRAFYIIFWLLHSLIISHE